MRMKTMCWLTLTLVVQCNCQRGKEMTEECPVITLTQAPLPDFSQFIENMRLVWIEPVEGTLFSQPDKIVVYKERLFLLDKQLKCVIGMDTTGHFLFRIQRIGKGPWEYSLLSAMWINAEQEELWLQSYVPRKIMVYSLDGVPRREFPIEWSFDDMAGVNGKTIAGFSLFKLADHGQDLGSGLFLLDNRGEVRKSVLPIGMDSWYYSVNSTRNLTESPVGLLMINQTDTVYRITPEGKVRKDFIADFGENSLPARERLAPFSNGKSKEMNQSNYVIGKDQVLGFGSIRLFKIFLKSQLFYALADLDKRTGCYYSHIHYQSGLVPILFPECVSDQGELVGLLNLDVMMAIRQSLVVPLGDPKGKALYDQLMQMLERGIRNDRPILWIAPIKNEWLTEKTQTK